jgi:hypothetical protein
LHYYQGDYLSSILVDDSLLQKGIISASNLFLVYLFLSLISTRA